MSKNIIKINLDIYIDVLIIFQFNTKLFPRKIKPRISKRDFTQNTYLESNGI